LRSSIRRDGQQSALAFRRCEVHAFANQIAQSIAFGHTPHFFLHQHSISLHLLALARYSQKVGGLKLLKLRKRRAIVNH